MTLSVDGVSRDLLVGQYSAWWPEWLGATLARSASCVCPRGFGGLWLSLPTTALKSVLPITQLPLESRAKQRQLSSSDSVPATWDFMSGGVSWPVLSRLGSGPPKLSRRSIEVRGSVKLDMPYMYLGGGSIRSVDDRCVGGDASRPNSVGSCVATLRACVSWGCCCCPDSLDVEVSSPIQLPAKATVSTPDEEAPSEVAARFAKIPILRLICSSVMAGQHSAPRL